MVNIGGHWPMPVFYSLFSGTGRRTSRHNDKHTHKHTLPSLSFLMVFQGEANNFLFWLSPFLHFFFLSCTPGLLPPQCTECELCYVGVVLIKVPIVQTWLTVSCQLEQAPGRCGRESCRHCLFVCLRVRVCVCSVGIISTEKSTIRRVDCGLSLAMQMTVDLYSSLHAILHRSIEYGSMSTLAAQSPRLLDGAGAVSLKQRCKAMQESHLPPNC